MKWAARAYRGVLLVGLCLIALTPHAARGDTTTRPATSPVALETPAEKRAAFLKLIARPTADLDAKEMASVAEPEDAGLVRIGFSFQSEPGERVPGILLKRHQFSGKLPVVIVAHGTGNDKLKMLPHLRRFAKRGYIAVAIDGRFHGERTTGEGTSEYNAAIARAFIEKDNRHPLYFDTAWDLIKLVDYLRTRHDVDPARIALTGFSKGGIETWLAAAADERIAVAVPMIAVQSFKWALENNQWKGRIGTVKEAFNASAKHAGIATPDEAFVRGFYDRVLPGIYDRFDAPAMLPLIAPRPLLVINGDSDDKTPLPGVHLAADAARKVYRAQLHSDSFELLIQEKTGHKVTDESLDQVAKFLDRHLKD